MPKTAGGRLERRRPGPVAEDHRASQTPAKPSWYRWVDVGVAYAPKGMGFVTGLVALWASPNKAVGTGVLIAGTAFDTVSTWWGRYKERRKERDEDR